MIVCIPSKGRPHTKTYKLFEDEGYTVYHFVEPQELAKYDVPNVVSIEQNDQGVTYVRNFMLNWCKDNGHDWAWICDDDVSGFGIYNGKTVKTGARILKDIETKAKVLPFEVVGMNYAQYAWTEKADYSINRNWCEVCALFHVKNIHWEYRENTKEDRDFQLQTIYNGNGVLRFNRVWFACPAVGSNTGGLNEWYAAGKDAEAAKKMQLQWGDFVQLKQKGDRLDIKVDIKGFAKSCGKTVK